MRNKKVRLAVMTALVSAGVLILLMTSAFAEGTQRTYIGATKCKTCHKKPEVGEQFRIWSESAHAKAYATLATAEAKKIADEKGLGDPQKADECLSCHVTGHGVAAEFLGTKYDATEGVTCESCHGPGGDYYKKATMRAITAGEQEGKTVGLTMPDEKTCTQCHNEKSPSFEGFDFEKMAAKIAHPLPEALKAKYEAGEMTGSADDEDDK